jgi:N utilization substance protein B
MKNSRRRAREFALQALYQWLVNESPADGLLAQLKEQKDFAKADAALAEALLRGVVADADALRALLKPYLDRPVKELSPVEHALLLLAACELRDQVETPYRVIINEAVELAKRFGAEQGHRFINGVLDKAVHQLRAEEIGPLRANHSPSL